MELLTRRRDPSHKSELIQSYDPIRYTREREKKAAETWSRRAIFLPRERHDGGGSSSPATAKTRSRPGPHLGQYGVT
ncbi:hypothetical protein MRX96_015257 [Rhipicephalus microplus]